jgi:hypothetical protein
MIIARCPDRSNDGHDNFHLERKIYLCFEGSNDLMKIHMVRIGKHLRGTEILPTKLGKGTLGKQVITCFKNNASLHMIQE